MEDQIALHEIGNYTFGRMADLMFGGGACHFLPQTSAGSCRADDIDVVARARQGGWTIQTDINDFHTLDKNAKLPLMHLFTPDHMSYEIDRDASAEPSLREMVEKAVAILERATRHSTKGYFLLIEGSRIDMAGHTNDAAAHVHEILAYDSVIEFVKQVVDKSANTMMISVSDHETGGLSVASQANETSYPEYLWYISLPRLLTT
jgi:alkaline phosphatase